MFFVDAQGEHYEQELRVAWTSLHRSSKCCLDVDRQTDSSPSLCLNGAMQLLASRACKNNTPESSPRPCRRMPEGIRLPKAMVWWWWSWRWRNADVPCESWIPRSAGAVAGPMAPIHGMQDQWCLFTGWYVKKQDELNRRRWPRPDAHTKLKPYEVGNYSMCPIWVNPETLNSQTPGKTATHCCVLKLRIQPHSHRSTTLMPGSYM